MNTIKSVDQVRSLANDHKVYVRWSKSIALDNRRGYSLRFGSQAESGLSCCVIDPTWPDWRILRQLREYRFCGGQCWIISGTEVGRGGDNEPLLRDVVCLGKVSPDLISIDWRAMELDEDITDTRERLSRATDPFGIKILQDSLNKMLQEREERQS